MRETDDLHRAADLLFPEPAEGKKWLECVDPRCAIQAEYDLDDDPERCPCGVAYDEQLAHAEALELETRAEDVEANHQNEMVRFDELPDFGTPAYYARQFHEHNGLRRFRE